MTPIHLHYDPSPANGRLLVDVRATRTADGGEVYSARVDMDDPESVQRCADAIARRLDDQAAAAIVLIQMQADAQGLRARVATGPEPDLLSMADVEAQPIRWLWPGRIALGKITLIVGDPGLGKSFLTCDLAAAVSRGMSWPDDPDSAAPLGDVILMNAEDDPADTIKPRLMAACADCRRIAVLQGVRRIDPRSGEVAVAHFSLERDLPMLRKSLDTKQETRLVVIDPISAFLGQCDSHNNAEVRSLLAPLAALASEYAVALVLVSHLNKSGSGRAVYRTTGSLAFPAAARAVWTVARDKDDPTGRRRLFLAVKNNLAADNGGLAYTIVDGAVAWESGPVNVSADDALDGGGERPGPKATTRTAAADWLRDLLANGPMGSAEIQEAAKQAGLSWSSAVRRAREELGIRPYKGAFGEGWFWALPEDERPKMSTPSLPPTTCSTCSSSEATCSSSLENTHTQTTFPPREGRS